MQNSDNSDNNAPMYIFNEIILLMKSSLYHPFIDKGVNHFFFLIDYIPLYIIYLYMRNLVFYMCLSFRSCVQCL